MKNKSNANILNIVEQSLVPLFEKALAKIYFFYDLLHEIKVSIEIDSIAVSEETKREHNITFKNFIFSANRDFLNVELSKIHLVNKDFANYYRFYFSGIRRNTGDLFDTEVGYVVTFKEDTYSIFSEGKMMFEKRYTEQLTTAEIAEITNHVAKSALKKVQQ